MLRGPLAFRDETDVGARPHEACTGVPREGYLHRVESVLEAWCLLAGVDTSSVHQFQVWTARLTPLPPPGSWPRHSSLCPDGSPVKLVESLQRVPRGPAYVCDPGPFDATADERWNAAWDLIAAVGAEAVGGEDLLRTLRAELTTRSGGQAVSTLWLGACFLPGRESSLRFYFAVGSHTPVAVWRRTLNALAAVGCAPGKGARNVFGFLAAHGYRQGFTVEISAGGRTSVEVYYRPGRVDRGHIQTLVGLAGIPCEVVTHYVHRMLRGSAGWGDARARIGVAVGPEGEIRELTLSIDPRRYFWSDGELRQRILSCAPAFGWDVSTYRSASRLIDADGTTPVRTLLGFGVSTDGHSRVSVEARTGHLASWPDTRERPQVKM